MSGAASLIGSTINLHAIREQTLSELGIVLDSIRGKKGKKSIITTT